MRVCVIPVCCTRSSCVLASHEPFPIAVICFCLANFLLCNVRLLLRGQPLGAALVEMAGEMEMGENRGKTTERGWTEEANTQAWHGLPLHAHAPTTDAYIYIYICYTASSIHLHSFLINSQPGQLHHQPKLRNEIGCHDMFGELHWMGSKRWWHHAQA